MPLLYNMNQNVKAISEILNMKPENEPFSLLSGLHASQMIFSDEENYLQFAVKGDRDVNKVKVTYDEGQDLFNVEFFNIKLNRKEIVQNKGTIEGLYNDSLVDAIWRRVVIV